MTIEIDKMLNVKRDKKEIEFVTTEFVNVWDI